MATKFPIATTANLPISGVGHASLPVIFLEDTNTKAVEPLLDALKWASALSVELKSISVQKHIVTLCNFINFYHLFNEGKEINLEEQTYTVLAYIDFRITGTTFLNRDHPLHKLNWAGVSKATASTEFRYIIRFLQFLEDTTGHDTKSVDAKRYKLTKLSLNNLQSLSERDFFIHLSQYRKFWEENFPNNEVKDMRFMKPAKRISGHRLFPTEEEVLAIIGAESNPVFKAIWLLQSYGASHRISEVLNIWQEDILPDSYSELFFGIKNSIHPTVVIAHPSESTWLGNPKSNRKTRMQHLLEKYGIVPRSERSANDPLYSGFKSKLLYGTHLTANTWWLRPEAAELFRECVVEIESFHRHNRTSKYHPYFFVNMYAKNEYYGEPLKKSRIESAWVSCCKRVGINPHQGGRNIHGLRHFQMSLLNNLQIPPEQIRLIRGDSSVRSQEDYGISAKSLSNALQNMEKLNVGAKQLPEN